MLVSKITDLVYITQDMIVRYLLEQLQVCVYHTLEQEQWDNFLELVDLMIVWPQDVVKEDGDVILYIKVGYWMEKHQTMQQQQVRWYHKIQIETLQQERLEQMQKGQRNKKLFQEVLIQNGKIWNNWTKIQDNDRTLIYLHLDQYLVVLKTQQDHGRVNKNVMIILNVLIVLMDHFGDVSMTQINQEMLLVITVEGCVNQNYH